VIGEVSQSFLHDPIQAHGEIARKRRERSIRAEADVEPILPSEIGAVGTQCRDESDVFECCGMQIVRQISDVVDYRASPLVQRAKSVIQLRRLK
jgi:hypothetical protein